MDEHASALHDPSNCPARIPPRTARTMIKWRNIRSLFSNDERDLQLSLQADTGQARKRLYMKGPMKLINAPIRAARNGGQAG